MKRLFILLLFPLMMFAQDSTLIGDVDCSGEVNSQDASLILQFVTNVIDSLPCEANMTGLTPEQLQEMIDTMEEQLSINYTASYGTSCDWQFPEGIYGEAVIFYLNEDGYTVPEDKTLYITNAYSNGIMEIDMTDNGEVTTIFTTMNYDGTETGRKSLNSPIILSEGKRIYSSYNSGAINGFLVDSDIEPIIWAGSYNVPDGKVLYVTHTHNDVEVNEITISDGSGYYWTLGLPIIVNSGSTIEADLFNGYLVDEDYFADCSGGGGSTTNSVAETGAGGVNLNYPEGYNGEPITFDLSQDYIVPEAKNLYITNFFANGGDVYIDGIRISYGSNNWSGDRGHSPFIASSGQIISSSQNGDNNLMSFNGYLVDKTIEPITFDLSQDYVVPEAKNLYMTNFFANGGDVYIDGIRVSYGSINWSGDRGHSPFIASSGQIISSSQNGTDNLMSFNGYLVDVDYFSSAGSGSNSAALDSTMVADMIQSALSNSVSIGVGDYYAGGVVAYIFKPGDVGYISGETHGYIAYYDNTMEQLGWGCLGFVTGIGVNDTSIGQGLINTQDLVSTCSEVDFAAKWCNDLTIGPYSDWFLPNANELSLISFDTWSVLGVNAGARVWTSEECYGTTCSSGCGNCCSSVDFANVFGTPYSITDNSIVYSGRKMPGGEGACGGWGTHPTVAFRQF